MTANTRRPERHTLHSAFLETVKQIPEWKIHAMEINRVLKEYDETLTKAAELRLLERGEVVTEEALSVEKSRIDTETAHALAKDYAEGKDGFAEYNACGGGNLPQPSKAKQKQDVSLQ